MLNKCPSRKEASQSTAWPTPLFCATKGSNGRRGPTFFLSPLLAQSQCPVVARGAPPTQKSVGALGMGRSRKHTEWHIGAASPECFLACKESFPEGEEFKFHDGNTTVFFFSLSLQCTGCLLRERPIFIRKSPPQPLAGAISNQPEILAKCKPHVTCIHTKPEADGCRQRPKPTRQGHNTHTHGLGMTPLELALRISTNTKIFRLLLYKILHRQKRAQFYAGFKGSYYTAPVSALHNGTLVLPSTMSIL